MRLPVRGWPGATRSYPLIASLIRAERTHRQARSISYRIGGAKFPVLKDIDTFTFADTPIDEEQVRELAAGTFLDAKRNAISIGTQWAATPIRRRRPLSQLSPAQESTCQGIGRGKYLRQSGAR